ncbi:adenosylhomocysteinase [Sporichthya sp.]|uniref:adenosylhomocysteinase n=1 Tax=Sporichthya sp. TaxID=65475 RepID=UPI00185C3100|nr:adenosylhomocysteinase [Sporichthya sp.]MBA3744044.1 adenosylhomocysteinase [Sporichthya sp.]
MAVTPFDVADPELAGSGSERIDWAARAMPVLAQIGERFSAARPLAGLSVAACMHVTAETANLMRVLRAGGASVALAASNPLSTQDEVAAALVADGVAVFARRGVDRAAYYAHIVAALDVTPPHLVLDDGCDLVTTLHTARTDLIAGVRGGTEGTTTGVIRLRQMARDGRLRVPMVAVNDTGTRRMFDNRYGTGQSTLDAIMRATNLLLAGRTLVVAGFGPCGQGVAERARGMGAHVLVTEIDPARALEATMDGFSVVPMAEAAARGDVFVTATGNRDVLRAGHFAAMRDGVILANAGHFDVEVDVRALASGATARRTVREQVEEFTQPDGRRLLLLAQGRVVNLAAAEGHPAAVMDMSFAGQALTLAWLAAGADLAPGVHPVPADIDAEVAALKLASLGVRLDVSSPEQLTYLRSWEQGS